MITMQQLFQFTILLYITHCECKGKIMRNNALMTKMISNFQKDNNPSMELSKENSEKPQKVVTLMQNVLCRNFPSIPCSMIMQDDALNKLIERSIQQINYKKFSMTKTTPRPGYDLTMFPVLNSEEMSNVLQNREMKYHKKIEPVYNRKSVNVKLAKSFWMPEKSKHSKKKNKKSSVISSRKKMRKFYPHKLKYKDKMTDNGKKDFGDYSEEKLSMSVEVPEVVSNKNQHMNFKTEPAESPVWRIDYTKHGEPNFNMFTYDHDNLKGKIMKTGPNVIVDENVLEQGARKDVLHPDVYIKKNIIRKKSVDINSEGAD